MKEKELDILEILEREENPTQREIARQTGMSLGMVNALIKKLVKKGMVKVERLNARKMKYILTPRGLKEKTQKTIKYVKKAYYSIREISDRVVEIAQEKEGEGKELCILGEDDEIREIITLTLKEMNIEYNLISNIEEVCNNCKAAVIYWDLKFKDEIDKTKVKEVEFINIFVN